MNTFKKIVLLSYISVASTESALLTPAFPNLQHDFALTTGQLSSLMTFFLLGYLLCQLAFGPLANRFGRLFSMRMGFSLNVLGIGLTLLSSVYPNYDLLLFSRFLTALGAGVGLSGTFTFIQEWLPTAEAKAALSYTILSFMLGIGLGIYVGGVLVTHWGWSVIVVSMLIYAILMLASTFLFQEATWTPQPITICAVIKGYSRSLRNPRLLRYAYILGYVTAISYLYSTAAPFISQHLLRLTPAQYGRWNLLIMLGMLMGSLHGKYLTNRYSMQLILRAGLVGFAACIAALILIFASHSVQAIYFFSVATLLYYFGGFVFPCASYLATEGALDRNNANGSMSFINMATAACSVVLLGYLPFGIPDNFIIILLGGVCLSLVLSVSR